MAGHKDILSAIKEGDVHIVEISRGEARAFTANQHTEETDTAIQEAFDEAQGEADTEGLATYVVIKINGGPI